MKKRHLATLLILFATSFTSIAQLKHSVSITGGFARTGSGDLWGTVVEGAYSYYIGNWSFSGQIGRADFSGTRTGEVQQPGLGVVNYVPADVISTYRLADILFGYTQPFASNKMNFIARVGPSLARTARYYIDPRYVNSDYDALDLGFVLEVGAGYNVITTGTAIIDLNLKASGRNYFGTDDGFVRLSVGITCRLYNQ
ncbi:MAG: hypothetical protein HWE14_00520 [Flavobacteriia bacterium]|nr:hypothetical protein [Flavobacteriia bacterium]